MAGQQGSRRDQPAATQRGREHLAQRRQDRPISPVRRRPGDLTAQHHDLVTQHHDLGVLGRLTAAQQDQPADDPDRDQVQQADKHKPRSCRNLSTRPNRRSGHTQSSGAVHSKDRVVPFPAAFKETLALHIDAQRRAGAVFLFESS